MKRVLPSVILAIGLILGATPARAIENGKNAIGGPVVGLSSGKARDTFFCSGAMLEPRIVITAHHCIETAGGDADFLLKNKITVSLPGTVLNNLLSNVANVLQIVTKPEMWTIGICADGYCDDLDDVAFLIIDRDFPVPANLKVATVDDLNRFRSSRATVITYGYGLTGPYKPSTTPFSLTARLEKPNPGGYGEYAFNVSVEGTQNICAGDSGGPSYVVEENTLYYLGPTSGTRRPSCIVVPIASGGFYGGTAIAFRPELLSKAREIANAVKATAELKAKQEAELKAKQELEARIAADLKAKQEAETKAAATRKTTITCVKGKLSKKITAVKPNCPTGYKLKK